MSIFIRVKDGPIVVIAETKGYNPNRAKDGKFTFGNNMSEEEMEKQFGTTDPYIYHLDYTRAAPIEFEEKGILPSKDGQFGKGVYLSNTKEGTQFNADLSEGNLYRVGKVDMIKEFGLYSSSKKGGVYKDSGLQYDDSDGQIFLEGNRSIPGKFLQFYDRGDWRDLKTWEIKEMLTADGSKVTILESKGYNPNRAKDGKFTFGTKKADPVAYEEEFDASKQGDPYFAAAGYMQEARSIELDDAQREAVEIYANTDFVEINDYLSKGKNTYLAGQVEFIDEAIEKGDIHRDTIVWRGADLGDASKVAKLVSMAETGGSFTNMGYTSTSLVPDVAAEFTKDGPGAVLFKIHLTKNDVGLLLPKVGSTNINPDEFEYLLPRQRRFSAIYSYKQMISGTEYTVVGVE